MLVFPCFDKILVTLAVGCSILGMPTTAVAQDAQHTVLIGVAGPLLQPRGLGTLHGVQFAINRINQDGLQINGQHVTLKLLEIDDKNDLNFARIGARNAVNAGVIGVIGHLTTDTSIAASDIYHQAHIPQLSPTAAGHAFTNRGYDNVFQMLGHSGHAGLYLAEEAIRVLQARRIMLIDNDTVLGRELSARFKAAVADKGGNLVAEERISDKSSDFKDILDKVKRSKPDLIFFAGVMPQPSAFAVRLYQSGLSPQLLLAGGARNPQFPISTEDYPNGTLLLESGVPAEKRPDFKALEKSYHATFSTPLTIYTLFAYDAVAALVEAMKVSKSMEPAQLVPTLHKIKFMGLSGPIGFAADGSPENYHYTLYRAVHGHWVAVNTLP